MATKPTVKQNTGIFASVVIGATLLLGYTYYLIQTKQHLDVQAIALASSWVQIKPLWARQIVSEGGYAGTLCALLLIMFQGVLYAGLALVAGYYGLNFFVTKSSQQNAANEKTPNAPLGVYTAEIPGSELRVMLPKYPGPQKGSWLGGAIDKNPYQQNFYRIDQAPLTVKEGVELTAHKKLYLAIYGMLKAHADVPASIGGHHADAPLFEHSLAVAKKVQVHYSERGKKESLAAIAGLGHDLDKLLAYKKSGDDWVKNVNATHHNKYAAYIVSTQPAFRELPEDDRNTLVLALRYYHDPENLPIGATNRTEALIQALRLCDGYAIKEEKAAGVESLTDEHLESIQKALLNTISELNINSYLNKSEHAGGWTTPALEYVLIPMSTVLEQLGKHLPVDLNRKMQLDHETRTFNHPAARLISQQLDQNGLLMTSYKSFSSEYGLYDCRIGRAGFRAVLMLQKSVLDQLIPGLQEKWENCAFRIRITGATKDSTVQGDSDVDEEAEEKEQEA
ncbi:HD domain-containing protein [Pseudomonas sp. MWU12-2323]|uniref:HD domain-containing protein n=1 Tax=Pseudomonas sp. MWU12-2323 TaxID=2651296 RepID=UPI0015B4374D|nr:HD domain-containing protein [Pseudomonas sp. MWU12-2323]